MPPKDPKKKSAQERAALIEQINIPQLTEILFDNSLHGNHSNLNELLTIPTKTIENLRFEVIQQNHLLQFRNDQTRTCLDLAAMLGHQETVKLLTEKSAAMMTESTNLTNGLGYSCLHLACAWNQLESVKTIIAAGGDIQLKTIHGEKPIDIAKRYHYDELVQYLEWIAIRNTLTNLINHAKDFLADPTKTTNKINKDDKKKMEKHINDTLKWFDENQSQINARELFIEKIKETEEFFAPIYANVTLETDSSHHNRTQLSAPKSGKK